MLSIAVFGALAVLISNGVECGYSSASSGSSSASDGSGSTFTQTNNNGQGAYLHTQTRPGGVPTIQSGNFGQPGNGPVNTNFGQPGNGPVNTNFGQPGFGPNYGQPGFGGPSYGPAFPYSPFGSIPVFNPIPPPTFGYGPSFQPFTPYQPLATPQEFNQYLNGIQQQYASYYKQQQEFLNSWKNSPFQSGYGGAPNYAYASGGIGPNGIHQTAGVFPQNKNKPNLDTRFDADNAGNTPPGGFFGVQTSSFSSSSDINGVKKHKEGAITTVNDNGKVTSYTVENP